MPISAKIRTCLEPRSSGSSHRPRRPPRRRPGGPRHEPARDRGRHRVLRHRAAELRTSRGTASPSAPRSPGSLRLAGRACTLQVDHGLEQPAAGRHDRDPRVEPTGRASRPEVDRRACVPPTPGAPGWCRSAPARSCWPRPACSTAGGPPPTGTPPTTSAGRIPPIDARPRRALRRRRQRVDLGRLGRVDRLRARTSSGTTTAPRSPTRWPATWSCRPTARVARPSSWPRRLPATTTAPPWSASLDWAIERLDQPLTVERPGRARPPQPPPVQPPVPPGHRHHAAPVAAGPAHPAGPPAARDHRPVRSTGWPTRPASAPRPRLRMHFQRSVHTSPLAYRRVFSRRRFLNLPPKSRLAKRPGARGTRRSACRGRVRTRRRPAPRDRPPFGTACSGGAGLHHPAHATHAAHATAACRRRRRRRPLRACRRRGPRW